MTNNATTFPLNETNGLENSHDYHAGVDYTQVLSLKELSDAKGKITRLRVLSDHGRYDISYVHATLPDGTIVTVRDECYGRGFIRWIKSDLLGWAKEQGVYAKGIGLLDEGNWSILR